MSLCLPISPWVSNVCFLWYSVEEKLVFWSKIERMKITWAARKTSKWILEPMKGEFSFKVQMSRLRVSYFEHIIRRPRFLTSVMLRKEERMRRGWAAERCMDLMGALLEAQKIRHRSPNYVVAKMTPTWGHIIKIPWFNIVNWLLNFFDIFDLPDLLWRLYITHVSLIFIGIPHCYNRELYCHSKTWEKQTFPPFYLTW